MNLKEYYKQYLPHKIVFYKIWEATFTFDIKGYCNIRNTSKNSKKSSNFAKKHNNLFYCIGKYLVISLHIEIQTLHVVFEVNLHACMRFHEKLHKNFCCLFSLAF